MIRLKPIMATAVLLCCCFAMYGQTISNKGKEFWVGYGHHQFMESTTDNSQNMVLYLSTEEKAAVVTVTIDSSGSAFLPPNAGGLWTRTYNIPPFTVVATQPLPKGTEKAFSSPDAQYDARYISVAPPAGTGGSGLFRRRTVHITSTEPIVAYSHIYGQTNSGATMLMPVNAWGYSYMSLNSRQEYAQNCYNWIYVIASKDNTVVEITPTVKTRAQNVTGLAPGVTKQVTLMKGQAYQIIGANLGSDVNGNGGTSSGGFELTGTTIKSVGGTLGNCNPIAVFAGSSRTTNQASCGSGGGDNDNQQLFPFHAWGKRYLTVPFSGSNNPASFGTSTYKIGVMSANTVVKRNGVTLTGLQLGKFYSFESDKPEYIEADKPIMVTQFMTGGSCLGSGGLGDPEMVVLAPIEQAIKQVGFYRNTLESIQVNYVSLVIPEKGLTSLRIDNSLTFDHVIDHPRLPGYKIVIKRWNAGQAQVFIKSDSAFNAITYGLGGAESYGYSAGAYVNNLNARPAINNIPDTTNGGNNIHKFTCVNTPDSLSLLLNYKTLKLEWDLTQAAAGLPANCWKSTPVFNGKFTMDPASDYLRDSIVIDGTKFYKYTLPFVFSFSCAGTYEIPVVSTSPGIDNCGNKEFFTFSLEVKPAPVINFTINHTTRCTKDTVLLVGPAAGLSGGTTPMLLSQWTWNYPGGKSGSKDTSVILQPGVALPIKLKGVTDQGCLTDSLTRFINVYDPPSTVLTATPDTLCLGQSVTFKQTATYGQPAIPINNYFWDFGDNNTANGTATTQVHTYASANVYTVRAAVRVSGLCVSDTVTKVVHVSSKAKVGFTYPTTCLPPSGLAQFVANNTAQGGNPIVSYTWDFGDPASGSNNTATGQSVSHTYAPTADSFKVTLTVVTNTGCTGDTAIWVNANIAPSLAWSASANFNSVCENVAPFSVAHGIVTNSIPGTPKYSGGAYIDSAGMFDPSVAGIGTHPIRYTFTSDKGCVEFKDTTITVNAKAAKPLVALVPYCQGATASPLTATADAGNTLKWYDNPQLTNGSTTAPTPSTATAGTFYYYVSQTPVGGCESDTSTVTVIITPSITDNTISANQTICEGSAAGILVSSATIAGGTGTYNHQWESSTDGSTWNNVPGATTESYDPGVLTTTTQFRRTVSSGLCSSTSGIVTITIVPAITNTSIDPVSPICAGAVPALLNGQTNAGTVTYTWESSADGSSWTVIPGATSEDYQPGALSATTHFRRTIVNGPCSASATVVVTVNPVANGSISGPAAICENSSTGADMVFLATTGTAPYSITYSITNPGGVTTQYPPVNGLPNNATIPVIPVGSAPGNYTVTLNNITNSNGCITNTGLNSITIAVTAIPVIGITPSPSSTVCEGVPVTLTASGATDYTWSSASAGANLTTTTGAVVSVTPSSTSTYDVTGTTNGCSSSESVAITVNIRPAKPVVTTPVIRCQNDAAVTLNATATGTNTLTWFDNQALNNGSTIAPTVSTATAGTFYYYVHQTNSGGCASDTSVVTVIIQPSIADNAISADQTICEGSPSAILNSTSTPTGGDGNYSYQWEQSVNGGSTWTIIAGATNASYDPGVLSATTQFRRVVSSGLCTNTSASIIITVVPAITNFNINGVPAICEGDVPNIISGQTPSGTGHSFVWERSTDNATWTSIPGATGVDYQPGALTTTTYFRRITNNAPCTVTSNTVQVLVNPLANGTISAPASICQYDAGSVTFNASVGTAPFNAVLEITSPSGTVTTEQWQNINSGDTKSIIPVNSAAGDYTIKLVSLQNSNGCIKTTGLNSITISVTATPVITIAPAGPICEGKTSPLSVSGATTYAWSAASAINFSSTTGDNVTAAPATAGSYPFTVTGTTNGCSASSSATLVVNPTPGKPSVAPPVEYCQLGPANPLQATATGSNTLKWYDNQSLTGGVTTAPTPSTANAGTIYYYVTQSNNFACESDTATNVVIVSPGISGNDITGGETICQGSTPATQLTGTGTLSGGNGSYAYQWQQSTDGGNTWVDISGATSANYSSGVLNTTTQFRRLVSSSLCGSASNVITVTVLIGLGNYDIAGGETICEGSSPQLISGQSTTGTGPFTYTWQQSSDGVSWTDIPSSDVKDYQPPVLTATTHYRRRVTNGPCTAISATVVTITVNPLANGTIAATPAAICEYESGSISFTSTAGTAPFDLALSITSPTGVVTNVPWTNVNSGNTRIVVPANSVAGNYTIALSSITNSNGCPRTTGLNSVTITVKPTPVITINPIAAICEADSATLQANGATTYAWSPSGGLNSITGNPVKAAPAVTTTYTVIGTTDGCSAQQTITLNVNPRPVVNITITDNDICLNENGIFSATSTIASGSVQSYYWDFDNGNTQVNPGSVSGTNPQTYSNHRTYVTRLYAVSDLGCNSATDTAHIRVNPLPVAGFTPPNFVCLPNNVASFQNTSTIANGASLNYVWNFGDPASGAANTSTAIDGSHVYPDSARYTVTLSVVSAQGCADQTTRDFDAFFRKPVAKFGVTPDTLCQGIQNLFMDSSFAPGSTIQKRFWMFGDGNSLQDSVNAAKIYTRPGNFEVALVVQNAQGCTSDTAYKKILVYLQPVIDAGPSFVVAEGTTVTFNASANSNNLQFAWASSGGATVSNPGILRPQYIADQDAKFILTATGEGNCQAWDSITVKVLRPLGIPNAFSPNDDNINDRWEITNLRDYPGCVVEVFNRYGQPVFRSFGYNKPWDGTNNGKPLPIGTYYYIIEPKNGFPRVTGYVVIVK